MDATTNSSAKSGWIALGLILLSAILNWIAMGADISLFVVIVVINFLLVGIGIILFLCALLIPKHRLSLFRATMIICGIACIVPVGIYVLKMSAHMQNTLTS